MPPPSGSENVFIHALGVSEWLPACVRKHPYSPDQYVLPVYLEAAIDSFTAIAPKLQAAAIVYRPLVWTAAGRPHPAVRRTMRYVAGVATRLAYDHTGGGGVVTRLRHEIHAAILRQRAAIMRAAVPKPRESGEGS